MNKKGFTLIELMVIVVIIFILASVVIPRLSCNNYEETPTPTLGTEEVQTEF